MDLFAQFKSQSSDTPVVQTASSAPQSTPVSASASVKIITVSIEKIKNRTVTVVYEMDHSLDSTVKTPEELLSKLKKKICNSNGFIRKPEKTVAKPTTTKHSEDENSDEDEDSNTSTSDSTDKTDNEEVEVVSTGPPQYVIQGNHSNAICKYIYSLGVKNIIRTGTA